MTRRWYTLLITAILLWLLVLLGVMWLETRPALADGEEGAELPSARVAQHGPPLTVLLVGDREQPAVEVPVEFAVQALPILQCESGWRSEAVGLLGELGIAQIHPIHRAEMAGLGLDFYSEHDRLLFAVILQERRGWAPWSCSK